VKRKASICVLAGLLSIGFCTRAGAEEWISIGPFGTLLANHDVISGQVNAIAVDPRDANIVYVGASEGGVWKTTDGGGSWAVLTDTQLVRKLPSGKSKGTLSIGSIALDPSNSLNVYVGTGDPNVAFRFVGPSLGVFRSTDGGNTWAPLGINLSRCENGTMSQRTVNRLLVVPRPGRPTIVYAATNFGLFRYRENGRDCWRRLTNGLPPFFGNAIDLVADPYQGALYVAYSGLGVFKSTDLSGAQWAMLGGGLPTSGFGRIALAFGGRTGVGFSQPLPLVYAGFDAGFDASNAPIYRLFVTKDGGGTWSELPSPPSDGQLFFNNTIAVGPYISDEVYIGQIAFWRATDGGRKGGKNDYKAIPPIEDNSWTVLGCCLSHPNPYRKNLDLHGDIHDIVFAPYGSFVPNPEQIQIVYVASDGGVTKGNFDFRGVVSWEALTKGLAIGQAGTIGLHPGLSYLTVAGYWHNGDILSLMQSGIPESYAVIGGDGFQTSFDAADVTVYQNTNAGFGSSIDRARLGFSGFNIETIWSDNFNFFLKHWSDPHRPGHLLRLQNDGVLVRTTVANTAPANVLKTAAAWEAVDPSDKTGFTTTMAFRSRVLEEQPVYYLGTSTGQVWRGSPEVGWTKLCECGAAINAIAPDLFKNERIFVALMGSTSPGRIKQVTRQVDGSWQTKTIDTDFAPDLDVQQVTSVVVDPAVPQTLVPVIYIGTDQGVYRGTIVEPSVGTVLAPGLAHDPPIFPDWTWRRSPGVPNVWVTDLEVHQNFQSSDRSGIVRAGTYGRGIFEPNRASYKTIDKPPLILSVQAVQMLKDGAPSYPNVQISTVIQDKKVTRETPFELAPPKGAEVTLEAPMELRRDDAEMKFVGWVIDGRFSGAEPQITLKLDEAAKVVAYYEGEESITGKGPPPHATVSTSAQQICAQGLTHELIVSWDVSDGQPPLTIQADILYPDNHAERLGFKFAEGSQMFPMSFATGGSVKVKLMATDSTNASSVAESNVELKPCADMAPPVYNDD
jgi:photosystem II stability/assembly factor-like uncharacterized protein